MGASVSFGWTGCPVCGTDFPSRCPAVPHQRMLISELNHRVKNIMTRFWGCFTPSLNAPQGRDSTDFNIHLNKGKNQMDKTVPPGAAMPLEGKHLCCGTFRFQGRTEGGGREAANSSRVSLRAQDIAAICNEGWTRIHRIERSEPVDIGRVHLYRVLRYHPVDDLAAGWCGERPFIGPILE